MDNNIELHEVNTPTETLPAVDMAKLVHEAMSGRFPTFTFPMVASGIDPNNPEEQLIKMIYPTLTFAQPANPRNVKRHIIKLIKQQFNKQITKRQAADMFILGIKHMYQVRLGAQELVDKRDESDLLDIVAKAQQRTERVTEVAQDELV